MTGTTTKYGWPKTDHSMTNVRATLATMVEMQDDDLHTSLRHKVASGEADLETKAYQPLCIQNNEFKLAKDGTNLLPVVGISTTAAVSGEFMLGKRIGKIINNSGENKWSWSPTSGEVWVDGSGDIVQGVSGENWMNRRARIGVVCNATSIIVQL